MNIPKFFFAELKSLSLTPISVQGYDVLKPCILTETPDKIQGFFDFTFLVAEVEL